MQSASAESVVDGVEPRGALPMPPTDCQANAGQCVSVWRSRTEDSLPDSAPFSVPFFSSSSSSISALTFVSTSSSRSYLLETFVDLTSPLRSVLLRELETIQSGSPYAPNARDGVSQRARRRTAQNAALAAGAGFTFGNSLADTVQPSSPYAMKAGWGQGVGRQAHGAEARRSPPGRAPETQ